MQIPWTSRILFEWHSLQSDRLRSSVRRRSLLFCFVFQDTNTLPVTTLSFLQLMISEGSLPCSHESSIGFYLSCPGFVKSYTPSHHVLKFCHSDILLRVRLAIGFRTFLLSKSETFWQDSIIYCCIRYNKQTNYMVWVRERTIPTERPPLVGEVIANFCG
jgi:hypothetical protein